MKQLIIIIVGLITSVQAHAQLLATPEDAEKAMKVVMICSKYTITDDNGPRDYTSESDLTIQQIKKTFSITAPCIQKSYELTQDNYRKIISNQLMNRDYMLFHKEDSIANPSFKYHCEVGNTGIIVSKFSISTPEMDVTFIVDKCIFISKDGLAHNFYCNRANSLESDLLVHYFDAIKIKKENASGLSGLFGKIKKKVSTSKGKEKEKKK